MRASPGPSEQHIPFEAVEDTLLISNQRFVDQTFEGFDIGPPTEFFPGLRVIQDTVFQNCRVSPYGFDVRAASVLRNVLFRDMKWKGELTICASAVFENVVVTGGNRTSSIRVMAVCDDDLSDYTREQITRAQAYRKEADFVIDISGYCGGYVEIEGWPLDKVRYDPEKCVRVDKTWIDLPWEKIEGGEFSIWSSAAKSFALTGCDELLLSIPCGSSKSDVQDRDVLSRIKEFI